MLTVSKTRLIVAFLAAVLLATLLGALVQTQFTLAHLAGIGVEIPPGVRVQTTLADMTGGFVPTYGGYVVLPSLLVAFAVAWWVARKVGRGAMALFALAGGVAILAGIPLVNYLSPVAQLVGASRDFECVVMMALGGAIAGIFFATLTHPNGPALRRRHDAPVLTPR